MLFAITCHDKKDHGHVRTENRPAHLAYLEQFSDAIFAAGPLLADDGETMVGSLLIMDMVDRAAAEDFCANDPYNAGGLFESVTIARWRKTVPAG